jgi:hypothetical protein
MKIVTGGDLIESCFLYQSHVPILIFVLLSVDTESHLELSTFLLILFELLFGYWVASNHSSFGNAQ